MKTLYDVCCDYSLDKNVSVKSRQESKSKKYKWREVVIDDVEMEIGTYKEYNEIHYVRSDNTNLQDMVI